MTFQVKSTNPNNFTVRRPEGGFKLPDIPSPSKGLKAIIGVTCSNVNLEFVIFLDWSKGPPQAQVKLKDPRVYIDRMASQFNVDSSSERISKSLKTGAVWWMVSVTISPAFVDDDDVYRMDVKINPMFSEPTIAGQVDRRPPPPLPPLAFLRVRHASKQEP